ncbi:MAG TPA: hypothetical protein VNA20_04850 [Frankiaceae bacterium]|nr:hypothetical protein [Frankiaceae bacterium]
MIAVRPRTVLAVALGAAYVACPLVEPLPNGPQPAEPWWLTALGIASIASILAACAAVGTAHRSAGAVTVLAGLGMAAMTLSCPLSGHHVTGWWTSVQWVMTAFVTVVGLALAVFRRRPERVEPVTPEWASRPERPAVLVIPAPATAAVAPAADVVRDPRAAAAPVRPRPLRPVPARRATRRERTKI